MSATLAAIVGGTAGAVALVGIVIAVIWFCLSQRRSVSRTSETGWSSDPSQVGRHGGIELSLRDTRRFEMEELSLATKNFSDKNLIGEGKFGEVYKGLLHDGILVAIKKRHGLPSQEFVDEARYLSSIHHRNLVTLLGYCQEQSLQFLIYEYVPNGSVSSHLYDAGQQSHVKLEFKLRLPIALGAARGLAHLHSMSPRLVHKNFKTANVLVDEKFIAKVADAGLRNFLGKADIAGPSSQVAADEIFLAPEVKEFRRFSEKSDVYSFGVFLLELLSGKEAIESPFPDSNQSLVEWVCDNVNPTISQALVFLEVNQKTSDCQVFDMCYSLPLMKVQVNEDHHRIMSNIIDQRLGNSFTAEDMEELILLIVRCLDPSSERRPSMNYVVMELDRILEKEMNLTTIMGEGSPTVTPGSQLFEATR